ncbi:MAG: hypothetical protein U0746_00415 [Gemmataceae bacterium]
MTMKCRWQGLCMAGLGLALTATTGCQTWVAGMTLPSGHYLEHRPQYFPPDPDFPLQRELNTQLNQDAAARAASPAGVAGPIAPVSGAVPATPTAGAAPAAPPAAAPAAPAGR